MLVKLAVVAVIAAVASFLYPKLEFAGAFHTVKPFNNKRCTLVPALQGCEDAYVVGDLAYLACASVESRHAWTPATLHLNASALPAISTDHISTYNFVTGEIVKLSIKNLPAVAQGIWVHAIEIHADETDPSQLTVLLNSHRPPKNRAISHEVGADSVIELFTTRAGSDELVWVQTVEHELIRTPNNLVAVGKGGKQFYLSNDHARKVHWTRGLEVLKGEPSDIIYCDASGATVQCKVAADGLSFPNGMAKGPGNTIYSASTLEGDVRQWEIQADNTLVLIDQYKVPRPIDNIVVEPTSGEIYVTTLPKVLDFLAASKSIAQTDYPVGAVEIWKISNDTSEQQFYGGSKKIEIVFADDGHQASCATVAAPYKTKDYKNKLLVSGLFSRHISVCDI